MAQPCHRTKQDMYTVVLLGRKARLKELMVKRIVDSEADFCRVSSDCVVAESSTFQVISTPDVFDEQNMYVDQHVIDIMALSQPGPHVFILAIDLENTDETKIVKQIETIRALFGEVNKNLVVTLPDIESFQSFSHLKEQFNILMTTANENLASVCEEWCDGRKRFKYHYRDYSEAVVKRRREALSKPRRKDPPDYDERVEKNQKAPTPPSPGSSSQHGNSPDIRPFSIILLGLTGTGKSASANTILKATKSKERFKSMSNSEPVTKECQVETTGLFGTLLTVVDTPDFFHESLKNRELQIEQCKKYLVPGHYVVLLVIKVNRFTAQERDILEKLENILNERIRDNTILLLTCGDELKGALSDAIRENTELQTIADQCKNRTHLFKNKKKNSEQVRKLSKKLKNLGIAFPKL